MLQQEGIDEDVPASFFYPRVPGTEQPDLEWLDETAIQENLAAIAGNTAEPGLHDLAITSVLIDGVDVSPDTPATVAAENPPEVEVTIANEGDTEETDVEIAVAVSGGDEPITAEEVIPGSRRPSPGRQQSRSSLPRPPVRRSRSRSPWAPGWARKTPPTTSSATRSRSVGPLRMRLLSFAGGRPHLDGGNRGADRGGVAIVALALALFCVLRLRRVRADQRAVIGEGSPQDLVGYARGSKLRSRDSRLAWRTSATRPRPRRGASTARSRTRR